MQASACGSMRPQSVKFTYTDPPITRPSLAELVLTRVAVPVT